MKVELLKVKWITNSFLMEGMPGLDAKGQMRGQMQEEQGGGEQTQRRVAPKAPTDPCPDGYQLIDGKCTTGRN